MVSEWTLQSATAGDENRARNLFRLSSQDASDSPSQTPELINLGSSLASFQTYQTNLGRVQTEVTGADNALSSGITLIESARTLAVSGANSTQTAADRQNLAVGAKYSAADCRSCQHFRRGAIYLGGDQDQSPPYQLNLASAKGVDNLTSQSATRAIVSPSGGTVYQSLTAAQIFDHSDASGAPAADNAFAALRNCRLPGGE